MLSNETIAAIQRYLRHPGERRSLRTIAKMFGVSHTTVSSISHGRLKISSNNQIKYDKTAVGRCPICGHRIQVSPCPICAALEGPSSRRASPSGLTSSTEDDLAPRLKGDAQDRYRACQQFREQADNPFFVNLPDDHFLRRDRRSRTSIQARRT